MPDVRCDRSKLRHGKALCSCNFQCQATGGEGDSISLVGRFFCLGGGRGETFLPEMPAFFFGFPPFPEQAGPRLRGRSQGPGSSRHLLTSGSEYHRPDLDGGNLGVGKVSIRYGD